MGRYILCGKEAEIPYEIDELDIRIYTIEELCYYIYNFLPLVGEDFIDERLLFFIRHELQLPEIADKIERFYGSRSEQDATLQMLLSDVGYYSDAEMQEFQNRLVYRRRKSSQERVKAKADSLLKLKRYQSAVRCYKSLAGSSENSRVSREFYAEVLESLASAYGRLCEFDYALDCLFGIYDLTKSERILKKAYDVCMLSGTELPQKYYSRVPDTKLTEWQKDYWNRETVARQNLDSDETMQIFLKDSESVKKELSELLDSKKETYRGMLE
ncbi:MAG: hypothetical protein IKR59_07010 [Lachnospiraceae bacterium]|nr:hypothetical protein [Lachnospiraceae bacterium]